MFPSTSLLCPTLTSDSQYTYYTVTAFNIRVPLIIKRSLTTLQITQFLVGATYAMLHSFVSYSVPVASSATKGAPAIPSVLAGNGTVPSVSIKNDITYKTVPCISNNGATFAVWLNVLYLAPLTYLFMSFFVESYLRRSNADKTKKARRMSNNVVMAEKAGWEAAKNVNREVYGENKEEVVATGEENGRVLRNRQ